MEKKMYEDDSDYVEEMYVNFLRTADLTMEINKEYADKLRSLFEKKY